MSASSETTRKYRTIVCDPPWQIKTMATKFCKSPISSELPYDTMSDEELLEFPINNFADEMCDLFLWTTKGKICFAFKLLEKWGFKYSNILVWNKRNGICSNGFHNTLEYVLYGYRGKCNVSFTNPLEVYFEAKRGKHSEKPSKFYTMLRDRTQKPRIDVFARKRHYGFDSWGNEVESQIQVPLLEASL